MARDRHPPRTLAAVHPRFGVPHHAELAVGAVAALLAATVDVRGAIGFSSFGVLAYYAVANAAASTLTPAEGRPPRAVPVLGLAGCGGLAFALPLVSVGGWGSSGRTRHHQRRPHQRELREAARVFERATRSHTQAERGHDHTLRQVDHRLSAAARSSRRRRTCGISGVRPGASWARGH
ncbi:hypothetical protein GCM10011583_64230 [Streptomyces camponoticapitis]|uniref:Integral membrane protein n=1 Tax=Streptomyces camponoticapitis TaxID=1616125 RepID=A0ABQ2ERX7_9ACTN|nr:hypothetical protein GCM10011583_64230 [Streptomyces camponoticapitis]